MQVVDTSVNDKVFAMIYGGSGTGKTHFIGTLGELGRVLVVDIDAGYKTIVRASDITDKAKDNITIVTFDQFKDLDTLAGLVDKNSAIAWSKALGIEVTAPFDWICYDTWTELQWSLMQQLRKEQSLTEVGLKFRKNIGIQHWGMLTDLNKLSIEQLKECSKASHGSNAVNQLFVFQEKIDKNEDLSIIEKGPAIHGKMMKEVLAYFDEVIHTSVTPAGKYVAATKPKLGFPAKSRLKAGAEYENPKAVNFFG